MFFLAGGENSAINSNPVNALSRRRKAEHRILTNERITVLYDADAGLPLSQQDGGTWEWLGSWRISKHETTMISASNRCTVAAAATTTEAELEAQKRSDCDEQGWSYVVEPHDFLLGLPDMIWDNPGQEDDANVAANSAATDSTTIRSNKSNDAASSNIIPMPKRTFRRRRWIRQRILVDYPHASESTRQYLQLLKENARLSAAATKISDQLVETKAALTESEEKLMEARDLLRRKDAALRAAGITIEEDSAELDDDFEDSLLQCTRTTDKVPMMQYSLAPDMGRSMSKEGGAFGSKISQWVQAARKTSEDLTSLDDESEEASNNGSGHGASSSLTDQQPQSLSPMDKFDWKKLGRGSPFIHKLKSPNRSGNSPLLTNQFKRSGSGRNIFRKADSTSLSRVGAPPFPTSTSAD